MMEEYDNFDEYDEYEDFISPIDRTSCLTITGISIVGFAVIVYGIVKLIQYLF